MSSTDELSPLAWLPRVTEVLDGLPTPWVIAGALAAERYRMLPRFTTDLDLLVRWHDGLPAALEENGYSARSMADPGEHPHLLMLRGAERIDLIIPVTPYQDLALERGVHDHYLTIEDVIVHKLLAWRLKDRDDIRSILERGNALDRAYIDHWAGEWEVLENWEPIRPPG